MFHMRPLKIGDESDTITTIKEWLKQLRYYRDELNTEFNEKTEDAVMAFQKDNSLYTDGVVGPVTMTALEEAIQIDLLERTSPTVGIVEGYSNRLYFVKCEADQYKDGFDFFWLRNDAVDNYNKVRNIVKDLGGKITSSGSRRSLYAPIGFNRSPMSMHYLGLAIDLHPWSGMVTPNEDPYVITWRTSEKKDFNVWVRCDKNMGSLMTLEDVVSYPRKPNDDDLKKDAPTSVKGWFQNLTDIFRDHGFEPIPPRRFFSGKRPEKQRGMVAFSV